MSLSSLYLTTSFVFFRFVGWGGESGKSSLEILEEILTLKEDQQLFEASMTTRKDQTKDRSVDDDGNYSNDDDDGDSEI